MEYLLVGCNRRREAWEWAWALALARVMRGTSALTGENMNSTLWI